ncbi:TPR-repeat-containing chaperone protein DNAJ, putative [Trypanosoma equiperdum]|uniref:TPR-repeat-containing chaperone protein DNAJ, putative n=4 Tax=Trypanozoon TaxID=39700 RepID=Q584G5_TRYB2|nr:TPR-repeat-containing chaperone protein DNAJ,putative [Trypanosoma brucei gambiense DAL972]XP_844372.1 TPR-repeat-containing chaperone protein DNAJ, putative [Trypanosoma brucei brucei TREU927]AAX79040.1 TPR-repeat-containing chaperone protein DNAJ, putative [Trypanosoma brucei]RHW73028.1 TPR-repeat-containing chaperone protein DNAJ [Trypanosoma brucei equiperdum]SCU69113.1 TPR-repeat-containing chaperone protein DNAJ, putative [Trypanosoma equiperdum]AAZ10813.1 TPR-repeat-containing chaper|eukprot:XP_011772802.1 TPR-repeat-containing chaperone protein DNAJ,putative [Trypanosoma brucei gambiense DAL972]
METTCKEDVPQVRFPSPTSSKSMTTSPQKLSILGDITAEPLSARRSFNDVSKVREPDGRWCRKFLSTYFRCELCQNVVTDPVQILPNVLLVCRRCALSRRVPSKDLQELPVSLTRAFEDLYEGQREVQLPSASRMSEIGRASTTSDEAICKRRMVRVKRPDAVQEGSDHSQTFPLAASINGTLNASGRSSVPLLLNKALCELENKEYCMRVEIESAEASGALELKKSYNSDMRKITARSCGTSKTLKTDADQKYEQAEYTLALELYTKAIELQPRDRLTRLTALYGNRSSAYFMAMRYAECIADCMKVVELDPNNVKLFARAAKAAAIMGDLTAAVSHMESIPEERVTPNIISEREKYKNGLDTYKRAESSFGKSDSDDAWQMLVAQFSDTIFFRIRYAESLQNQKRFLKAVEVLDVVPQERRTPKLLYIMAACLFMCGFEHFDKARTCLEDVQQLDENCAQLLKVLNIVDEGKQKGNQYFQQKKFVAAMEHYTTAIGAAVNNNQILRILYCNRAASYKEVGKYREAIEDCTRTIQLDPAFSKAYARRARCHQALSDFASAIRDFKAAIKYDPNDQELPRELRSCEQSMAKEGERERDYYYVLGVSRNATEREIKARYRELSLRWHPDKCMSLPEEERVVAERKFKIIVEAHTTLIDAVKRRDYDLKMEKERLTRSGGFGGFNGYSSETFRGHSNRFRQGSSGFW